MLFTDVVGSTELSSQLGPAAGEELRSTYFELMREAVRATGGAEVKSTGDGLMVAYEAAVAALDGAVAVQQAIGRYNRKATVPIRVRVGLSTGDVVEDERDYFGEAVVVAARLCDAAEGGQILAADVVRTLARRADHRFQDLGTLELKGLPDPVATVAVLWEPLQPGGVAPLPSRMTTTPETGVVGRTRHVAALREQLKEVVAGVGCRVVLMSGEPGVGKTTLAAELCQGAHADGATVLYGRCDEDVGRPYKPFVEALGAFVAECSAPVVESVGDRHLSELSRIVPRVLERLPELAAPPSTEPDVERHLLFTAATAFFDHLARIEPVVLVIDDLHWADKASALLLRHLVETLDAAGVLIVGTYRDTDLEPAHPFADTLARLWREPSVTRLSVEGLDDDGVVELLEAFAGHDLDATGIELARTVRRETGGNPFFTAEVLRHLAETNAIREENGRWVAATELSAVGLPDSVREVVGHRVHRLGDRARHVLEIAAVLGREFDLDLLARAADHDPVAVLDVLDIASARHIVSEVAAERYAFTHALFQHTLYDSQSASRRRRAHRRVGELLEEEFRNDRGDGVEELARHWLAAASPAETTKAARYARLAGDAALASLAPDAAIAWFRRALDLLDASSSDAALERLDALIGLGTGQLQTGDPEHRTTLLSAAAEAERMGETDRQVAAALANNRGIVSNVGTVDDDRIAMLESAIDAAGSRDDATRALLLATLAAEITDGEDRSRVYALASEGEAIARRLGDEPTLLRVLNVTFLALWAPATIERCDAVSSEALALAERTGDPVAHFWAALNRVYATSSLADRHELDVALALTQTLAAEIDQPFITSWATQVRCPQVLLLGDVVEAERLAERALEINLETGQPDAFAVYGANLAGIRLHQGALEDFLPLIGQAAAENPGIPAFQAAYAQMLVECDRHADAQALLDVARKADFHNEIFDYGWITMTTLWADAAAGLGDADASALLYERLLPYERQGVSSGASSTGVVAAYLGRLASTLGDSDRALQHFALADDLLASLRAPFWRSRNQLEWARELISRSDPDAAERAQELLAESIESAERHGCDAVATRARNVLDDLRSKRV